MYSLMKIQ